MLFFLLLLGILGGLFSNHPCTVKKGKTSLQNGCIQRKLFFNMGASRENFSSKWEHPEKTFLQHGCIQRKLFFKMGASREYFSSTWVHPGKTVLQKESIQRKLFFKMGASMENITSKWIHQVSFFYRIKKKYYSLF